MPREKGPSFQEGPGEDYSGMSYYEILGVSASASSEEIRDEFIKLSKKHHPDVGGDELRYQYITEAYTILSDPDKKNVYDAKHSIDTKSSSANQEGFEAAPGAESDPYLEGLREQERIFRNNPTIMNVIRGMIRMHEAKQASRRQSSVRRQREREPKGKVFERDGLLIEKRDDLLAYEYLLDPESRRRISHGFDKIFVREGLVIGKSLLGEWLLDKETGRKLSRYYDSIVRRGNKIIGINELFGREEEINLT